MSDSAPVMTVEASTIATDEKLEKLKLTTSSPSLEKLRLMKSSPSVPVGGIDHFVKRSRKSTWPECKVAFQTRFQ